MLPVSCVPSHGGLNLKYLHNSKFSEGQMYTNLSFTLSGISKKQHLGGGEPPTSSDRKRFLSISRARTQMSADLARQTDAAVGRQFSSVRYFVLVDGQPWLTGETRERGGGRREEWINHFINPYLEFGRVTKRQPGEPSMKPKSCERQLRGLKVMPGDKGIAWPLQIK